MDELTQRFFETLLQTQFMPAERMLAYQHGLLERLLRHARAQVPFYRDSGRLDVLFSKNDRIDWERWNNVPVLTRHEAQENAQALYAETVPPECGAVISSFTAGSTGTPLAYRANAIMAAAGSAAIERGFVWAGLPERLTVAWLVSDRQNVAPYPTGEVYQSTIRGATRMIHRLVVQTPLEDQGRWLANLRPDVVMGYPGALALLAQNLPRALDAHRFRLAVCVGEVTTDAVRAAIESGFRCPVMDLYSGSEFGPVAVEDHTLRRLFVCEETLFLEFRAPTDLAASDDALTELIFTPFYNYAMPLIRYACGDFAVVDEGPAPDKRTLRRLLRIAGRERNVFVLPSGQRWWPTYRNGILRDYIHYTQLQFAQTARNRIEFRYASDRTDAVKDTERLLAYLRETTPEPMEIALVRVATIERRPSGKYEYATCEIEMPS